MNRIILTGYMGAGKTTLGKAFARRMNLSFIDLDWYIEERFRKTIRGLFAERGEDGFRDIERRMLREVLDFEDVVDSALELARLAELGGLEQEKRNQRANLPRGAKCPR